ncbi:hypothetical protein MRX96_049636 [Rhipicephalus microplus]
MGSETALVATFRDPSAFNAGTQARVLSSGGDRLVTAKEERRKSRRTSGGSASSSSKQWLPREVTAGQDQDPFLSPRKTSPTPFRHHPFFLRLGPFAAMCSPFDRRAHTPAKRTRQALARETEPLGTWRHLSGSDDASGGRTGVECCPSFRATFNCENYEYLTVRSTESNR